MGNVVGSARCDGTKTTVVTWTYQGANSDGTTAGAFAPHQWGYLIYPNANTAAGSLEIKTVCQASGLGKSKKDEQLIAYSPVFGDKDRILKYDMEDNLKNQESDEGLSDPTKLV